jgi:diaminohydroxyphosphoribosylaminopyrimidine deaminase/5-amino-6-(5-phosphoribosylamino)uracil reductase
MVGALVVSQDGVVVGHGWHEQAGAPHAETRALDAAGDRASGGTLYVTLEPCCHTGRTGPCTRRIIDARIARVVAAMEDPDPRVSGRGFKQLRAHGIAVLEGLCEDEAVRLNRAFLTLTHLGRPMVILKAATSLDACVAAGPGRRTAISSTDANRRSQVLRAGVDAIAVGSETVLVDDPLLTARSCYRARPLVRVIFDRRLRTPPSAQLFSTLSQGPVIMVTEPRADGERAAALRAAGATLLEAETLQQSLAALTEWDVSTMLVEGGPTLQRSFVEAGLVERVHLLIAPHTLGAAGVKWLDTNAFSLQSVSRLAAEPRGTDIWIEADVHRHR